MAQCEYKRYDEKICTETAHAGHSMCILHVNEPAKDAAEFLKALKNKVEREERDSATTEINLAGVVFPPRFRWADVVSSGKALGKSADFWHATFTGDADFGGARFSGAAYFVGARFSGAAYFWRARFSGAANFVGARFSGAAGFEGAMFSGAADFGGARFSGAAYFGGARFSGAAGFGNARFSGAADFWGARFSGAAGFWNARFSGAANFGDATFNGDASFGDATFSGDAVFGNARFSGAAVFRGATFNEDAGFEGAMFSGAADFGGATFENWLRFQGTTFPRDEGPGVVRFEIVTLEKPERAYFQDVNLSRVSFMGTDVRHVHFLNTTWAKLPKRARPTPRWWPFATMRAVRRKRARWPRSWPLVFMTALWRRRPTWLRRRPLNVLYDDPRVSGRGMSQESASQAAELYRQLRVNLEENRQHIEAGDFYVGQMDMRLHDTDFAWRSLLRLYGVVALYGESYWRPLFLYVALGLLFAVGYLWGGFQGIEEKVQRNVWVGPSALWDWSFLKDYVQAFLVALTPGAPFRAEPQFYSWWLRPVQYANTLLNVVVLTMAVIALRRAFRR